MKAARGRCDTATHTDRGTGVQLVLGSNTKAGAVTASGPGQVYCSLQLVIHFLVDGPTKLRSIITAATKEYGFRLNPTLPPHSKSQSNT